MFPKLCMENAIVGTRINQDKISKTTSGSFEIDLNNRSQSCFLIWKRMTIWIYREFSVFKVHPRLQYISPVIFRSASQHRLAYSLFSSTVYYLTYVFTSYYNLHCNWIKCYPFIRIAL